MVKIEQIQPIPLKPSLLQLSGISSKQIKEHYERLYKGYVKTVNEIRAKLPQTNRTNQNPRYTPYRELKLEETFMRDRLSIYIHKFP